MQNLTTVLALIDLLQSGHGATTIAKMLHDNPKFYGFVLDTTPDLSTHDGLVLTVLSDSVAMDYMVRDQKIMAIKRLREIGGIGPDGFTLVRLRAAKDAVEDQRVKDEVTDRALASLRHRLNS